VWNVFTDSVGAPAWSAGVPVAAAVEPMQQTALHLGAAVFDHRRKPIGGPTRYPGARRAATRR
jgi:hypothetical protein